MDYDAKIKELEAGKARKKAMQSWKKRLRSLRKKHGITAKSFAEEVGVDATHLSHQKAGRRGASKKYFDKVERGFKKYGV